MKITSKIAVVWDNAFAQEMGIQRLMRGDTQYPSFGCVSSIDGRYFSTAQHTFQGTITTKQHQHCIFCHTKISMDNSGNLQYEPSEKLIAAQFKKELGE